MRTTLLFSVVIPAYNYAYTLTRAIESVLEQITDDAELLVIDDGSSDHTREVITEIPRHRAFRVIHSDNAGLAATRNRGIRESRGDWLVFLDADDEFAPGALQALKMAIVSNSDIDMIIGAHIVVESGRQRLRSRQPLPKNRKTCLELYLLKKRLSICNGATAMKRRVFERYRYPENFRCVEDIPVFAHTLVNYRCMTLNTPIAIIHKHEDSLRHDTDRILSVGTKLVDEVFDEQRMPAEVMGLKSVYFISWLLSLFRILYRAEQYEKALPYWVLAIRHSPLVIVRYSFLGKAIRAFFLTRGRAIRRLF